MQVSDLEGIKDVNGITISEIERRCKPLRLDSNQQPLWDECEHARCTEEADYVSLLRMMRSLTGFLGEREAFIDVLKQDWHTVTHVLQTSNKELAEHLMNILELCPPNPSRAQSYYRVTYNNQPLEVKHMVTRGEHQLDVFADLESDQQQQAWNDEYHIRHGGLDLTIHVGGNRQQGVVQYIYKYGFYEGGAANNNFYRIDPCTLWCIVHGEWQPAVLKREVDSTTQQLQQQQQAQHQAQQQIQAHNQQLVQLRAQFEDLKRRQREGITPPQDSPTTADILYSKEEIDGDILYQKSLITDTQQQMKVLNARLQTLRSAWDKLQQRQQQAAGDNSEFSLDNLRL